MKPSKKNENLNNNEIEKQMKEYAKEEEYDEMLKLIKVKKSKDQEKKLVLKLKFFYLNL
jgi:hypothetical protein